jgi:hypothetical protein
LSTRANIIVTDGEEELIFYRHCDGYPDGTLPSLTKFVGVVRDGILRDNISQACGWLIVIGALEDGVCVEQNGVATVRAGRSVAWKVGAYEPAASIHGDIDFLYVVDLKRKQVRHHKIGRDTGPNVVIPQSFYSGRFNPKHRRSPRSRIGMGKGLNGSRL